MYACINVSNFFFNHLSNILKNHKDSEKLNLRKKNQKSVEEKKVEKIKKKIHSYWILDIFDKYLYLKGDDNDSINMMHHDGSFRNDSNKNNDDEYDDIQKNQYIQPSYNIVCSFLRHFSMDDLFQLECTDFVCIDDLNDENYISDNNDYEIDNDNRPNNYDYNDNNSNDNCKDDNRNDKKTNNGDYNLNYDILNKMHANDNENIDICTSHKHGDIKNNNNGDNNNDHMINDKTDYTDNEKNNHSMNKGNNTNPISSKFNKKSSFLSFVACSEKSLNFLKNVSNILTSTYRKSTDFPENENKYFDNCRNNTDLIKGSRSDIRICKTDLSLSNKLNMSICTLLNNILLFDDFEIDKTFDYIMKNYKIKDLIMKIFNNMKSIQCKYEYKYWSKLCIFHNFNALIVDIIMIFTHKNTEIEDTKIRNRAAIRINTSDITLNNTKNNKHNTNNTTGNGKNIIFTNSHLTNSPLKRKFHHNRYIQTDSLTGLSGPGSQIFGPETRKIGPEIPGSGSIINMSGSKFNETRHEYQDNNGNDYNIFLNDSHDNAFYDTKTTENNGNHGIKNIQIMNNTYTENLDSPPLKLPHTNDKNNTRKNDNDKFQKFEKTKLNDISIDNILEEPDEFIMIFNDNVKTSYGSKVGSNFIDPKSLRSKDSGSTYIDPEDTVSNSEFGYCTFNEHMGKHPVPGHPVFGRQAPGFPISGHPNTIKLTSNVDISDQTNVPETDLSFDIIRISRNDDIDRILSEENNADIIVDSININKSSIETKETCTKSVENSANSNGTHEGGWSGNDLAKKWGINF